MTNEKPDCINEYSIIEGIAKKLNLNFGSDHAIYDEDVPQGFTEPCFSIVHIRTETIAKLPPRYMKRSAFDIHFFPKPDGDEWTHKKKQMYFMARNLTLCLEYINVLDNLLRGSKMRYEIVDGVLHFFVNYDYPVLILNDDESVRMTNLKQNQTVEE